MELDAEPALDPLRLLDRRLGLLLHLRVPVHAGGNDERDAALVVELLDEVLLAEVEVDRALVDGRVRPLPLDEAEERSTLPLDDGERVGVARAERDPCGRVVAPLPDVSGGGVLELRKLRRPLERLWPELRRIGLVERRLVGGRVHVGVEDPGIRVVEDRRLDAAREECVRLAREELVERVLARDEHGQPALTAAGAAPLLTQRGDRPREADRDRAVEEADVDAELERVGRRHAEQLALDEASLDVAPLLCRVAGAIGGEASRGLGIDPLGREAVDQLGRLAALREADRPQPP